LEGDIMLDTLNREYTFAFDSAEFLREGGCVSYTVRSDSASGFGLAAICTSGNGNL
jgi:hypothetical protein